jgi:predicted dienelactone hydrolase
MGAVLGGPVTTLRSPQAPAAAVYPVAGAAFVFSEPVPGGGARLLPTRAWYPAQGGGAPYPLVLFAVGYDIDVSAYAQLLTHWAAAGFVVVAPQFPHNSPQLPSSLDENDIVNHPADLSFVLTAVLRTAAHAGSPLSGIVDAREIAVVGHSDGAEVALAVADNSCCRDGRVRAVAVLAGAELDSFPGTYFGGPRLPLLVAQGDADAVNPPACSAELYDQAKSPKYYLDLLGAGHEPPFAGPSAGALAYRAVVERVTTAFLEGVLKGSRSALMMLAGAGDVAGVARLIDAPRAPFEPGTCPGA